MVVRELLIQLGFQVDQKPIERVDGLTNSLIGGAKKLAVAFAGMFAAAKFKGFIQEQIHLGSEINDTAARLGVATDELQRFGFMAKLSGVEAGAMQGALLRLQRATSMAAHGGKGAAAAFRALGVRTKDSRGNTRTLTEMLPDLADGFSRIRNSSDRTALAMQLFGRGGAALLPVLMQGRAGIERLNAEIDDLGGVMGEDFIKAADDAGDAIDKFEFASQNLRAQIAIHVLPAITRFAESMAKNMGKIVNFVKKHSSVITTTFAALGTAIALAGVKALLPWLPMIAFLGVVTAGVVLLVLAFQDLYTWINGGSSVTGHLIDALFGVGTSNGVIATLVGTFQWFSNVVDGVVTHVMGLYDAIHKLATAVVEMVKAPSIGAAKKVFDAGQGVMKAYASKPKLGTPPESIADQANKMAAQGKLVRLPFENTNQAAQRSVDMQTLVRMRQPAVPATMGTPPALPSKRKRRPEVNAPMNVTINGTNMSQRELESAVDKASRKHMERVMREASREVIPEVDDEE